MKNIHLISTDKETNLAYYQESTSYDEPILQFVKYTSSDYKYQHIYITNEEPIKINEPYLGEDNNIYYLCEGGVNFNGKKIVLTNDKDLIEDGVQEVSSSFLSFYAENQPDYVEVEKWLDDDAKKLYTLNFPQKDKFTEETEKFVKEQSDKYKKWAERNKTDWIFERSSGYPGYRNTETNEWIYESEYLEKFGAKENQTAEEETLQKIKAVLPNESQAIRLIEQYGE